MAFQIDEKKVAQAIEDSLVKTIHTGGVFKLGHEERLDYGPMLRKAYESIDVERLEKRITESLEEVIAEKVVNKIVTEMGNDIKSLMSRAEIREDFKYFLRSGIETILGRVRKKERTVDPEDEISAAHDAIKRRPY